MPVHDDTVVDLLKSAVRDAQDLVRSEIALARAELRLEARRVGTAAAFMAGAAIVGLVGFAFLMSTLAWGIAQLFEWPAWIGFAVVTLLLLVTAGALAYLGRSRLVSTGDRLSLTRETLKENAQWIRARTS
jgi:hypothetical protein